MFSIAVEHEMCCPKRRRLNEEGTRYFVLETQVLSLYITVGIILLNSLATWSRRGQVLNPTTTEVSSFERRKRERQVEGG